MRILYYHGGPGLNSNPEKNILTPTLNELGMDVRFWSEPSRFRDHPHPWKEKNAFDNYLESAANFLEGNGGRGPLILAGHSFGAHPVRFLSREFSGRVHACVFIAPDLSLRDTDVNMFSFIRDDYRKHGDDRWIGLQKILDEYSGRFDENTGNGFKLLLENTRLFDYYWLDKLLMQRFLGYYTGPDSIDIRGFFGVRRSWHDEELSASNIPAIAMFGRHDIVVSDHAEISVLQENYSDLNVFYFGNSAHYPHIEEKDAFFRMLKKEILKKVSA